MSPQAVLSRTAVMLTIAALLLLAAPAWAQTAYSAEKLEAFVSAALAVGDLADKWETLIEEAPTQEEAQTLNEQATNELIKVVSEVEGITVEEYMEINRASQQDQTLHQQIREIYDRRTQQQ